VGNAGLTEVKIPSSKTKFFSIKFDFLIFLVLYLILLSIVYKCFIVYKF